MGTTLSFRSSSGGDVRIPVPRTQLNGVPPPPPGLEDRSPMGPPHGVPVKAAPVRPRSQPALALTSSGTSLTSTSTPFLQPQVSVPPKWEHIQLVLQLPTKGVLVPPLWVPTLLLVQTHVLDVAFLEASACSPAHDQFWTCQTCWTRPHSHCGK